MPDPFPFVELLVCHARLDWRQHYNWAMMDISISRILFVARAELQEGDITHHRTVIKMDAGEYDLLCADTRDVVINKIREAQK